MKINRDPGAQNLNEPWNFSVNRTNETAIQATKNAIISIIAVHNAHIEVIKILTR